MPVTWKAAALWNVSCGSLALAGCCQRLEKQPAEGRGKPEISSFIQPRMVLKSIVQLLTPLVSLPDYGDSHWMMHSQWEWLACLEWGAHVYQDSSMKWAAHHIWEQCLMEINQRRRAEGRKASEKIIGATASCPSLGWR